MSTPAVCEISACGVLAVGRCLDCARAFCRRHEFPAPEPGAFPVPGQNLCHACAESRDTRRLHELHVAREAFERVRAEAWSALDPLLDRLRTTAPLRVDVSHTSAWGWNESWTPVGSGWPIPAPLFSRESNRDFSTEVPYNVALVDAATLTRAVSILNRDAERYMTGAPIPVVPWSRHVLVPIVPIPGGADSIRIPRGANGFLTLSSASGDPAVEIVDSVRRMLA